MKHFTFEELIRTSKKVDNTPDVASLSNLEKLVDKVLDPARELFGAPIKVTSGYRSKELNMIVGGDKKSQHLTGHAADLKCSDNMKLFLILIEMEFDQLIYEYGNDEQPSWIHVSYVEGKNRNQVLRAKKVELKTVYLPY
jgi:zinc D-Ala-D-Ala carboxypeptidase